MLTILGAMDRTGMLATMTVEAATDGDVFLASRHRSYARDCAPDTWS